jgi:hypothetical protein
MGVRHQQLVEQLVPLLKFYVAYPISVNQANAGKPYDNQDNAGKPYDNQDNAG